MFAQVTCPTLRLPSAAGEGRRGAALLLQIHGRRTQPRVAVAPRHLRCLCDCHCSFRTYGDTGILANMYPSMTKLLQFWEGKRGTDGLLHAWTDSQWDFLGDWITPHGSEANITSPENILFNTCYYRHVAALAANISRVLGMSDRAQEYDALARDLSAAIIKGLCNAYPMRKNVTIHSVLQPRRRHFRRCAAGERLGVSRRCNVRDTIVRQTHLVMPLASGVVEGAAAVATVHALEQTVRAQGHVDTGLTGTYFMCVRFRVACRVQLNNHSNSGRSYSPI